MHKPLIAAIFADSGETHHHALYRYVGETIARSGGAVVCVANKGRWPLAVVEAVLGQRGRVSVVTTPDRAQLDLPQGVTVEIAEDEKAAGLHAVSQANVVLGLPARLDATALLYAAWVAAGGAKSGKLVGLLNSKQAFEVVRGFITDVANPGLGGTDELIQISENFDDLWGRMGRMVR